ncbi:MAG: uroporphyrinogen-III synthase [Rhizobiales bacterium]|nr:uroporphyrinogen-III synthase [Hyphomicrobiales bacterium]
MHKILVTRPLEDYQRTADNLFKLGFAAIHAPMMVFKLKAFIKPDISQYSALIFTSANGIRAIEKADCFSEIIKLPCYVVGAQTAEMAKKVGFKIFAKGAGDVNSLCDVIINDYRQRGMSAALLHVSGLHKAGNLSRILKEAAIDVGSIHAYEMLEEGFIAEDIQRAFMGDDIKAILLYSPRSAKIFVKNIKKLGLLQNISEIPTYCLSNNIAELLRKSYLKHIYFVEQPNEAALLNLLHKQLN